MKTYTFTFHYGDLSDNATNETIDKYYDKYPLYKTCDIIDVTGKDIIDAYETALDLSDQELEIEYVEVLQNKKWCNMHEILA